MSAPIYLVPGSTEKDWRALEHHVWVYETPQIRALFSFFDFSKDQFISPPRIFLAAGGNGIRFVHAAGGMVLFTARVFEFKDWRKRLDAIARREGFSIDQHKEYVERFEFIETAFRAARSASVNQPIESTEIILRRTPKRSIRCFPTRWLRSILRASVTTTIGFFSVWWVIYEFPKARVQFAQSQYGTPPQIEGFGGYFEDTQK